MQNPKDKQEDPEPQEALMVWFMEVWEGIEANYVKILAGIGAGIAAVLIAFFINQNEAQETEEANQAMGQVYISLFEGQVEQAITHSRDVLNQYGDMPVAREALVAQANLQFEQGNVADAQQLFQQYLQKYGSDGPLGYGAWAGLAACIESEQNFSGAAQKFAEYATKHPDTPFAPIALKEAGRCYELANAPEQAQQAYQQVVDQYKESPVTRIAMNELQMMGVETN